MDVQKWSELNEIFSNVNKYSKYLSIEVKLGDNNG